MQWRGQGLATEVAAVNPSHFHRVERDRSAVCTTQQSATITQPASAVSASETHVNVLCFGGSTGSIDITPAGGVDPYTFLWADGPTTEDRTGLAAGTYTVTVTDANGCTTQQSATITQPASAVSASETHSDCSSGSNGSIDITPAGGVGPYTFLWADGPTTEDRTGLAAGTYTVTVTDANGCSTQPLSITIPQCEATGFCTLTQGAYGNAGGVFTNDGNIYSGLSRLNLIQALLGDTSIVPNSNLPYLIVGIVGTRSLTIPLSAAQCIMTRLPAGGTPTALPNFAASGGPVDRTLQDSPSCQVPLFAGKGALPLKNGKFVNVLLGQTITLGLNVRLDPTLLGLDLTNPVCIEGGGTLHISQAVIDALSNIVGDTTVAGLQVLANRALAGLPIGPASVSDVNAAVSAINQGFDGCRSVVACSASID